MPSVVRVDSFEVSEEKKGKKHDQKALQDSQEFEEQVEDFRERLLQEEASKPPKGPNGTIMARQRIEKRVVGFKAKLKREMEERAKAERLQLASQPVEPEIYRYTPPAPRSTEPPRIPSKPRVSGVETFLLALSDRPAVQLGPDWCPTYPTPLQDGELERVFARGPCRKVVVQVKEVKEEKKVEKGFMRRWIGKGKERVIQWGIQKLIG